MEAVTSRKPALVHFFDAAQMNSQSMFQARTQDDRNDILLNAEVVDRGVFSRHYQHLVAPNEPVRPPPQKKAERLPENLTDGLTEGQETGKAPCP